MNERPLVSIISPCYNVEKYIGRFIDSIAAQDYPSIELVLINDGSEDGTECIIESYKKRLRDRGIQLIYEQQENGGQASALNRGLQLYTGKYVTWVDADDEFNSSFISAKVDFLQKNPKIKYCYGKAVYVTDEEPDHIIRTVERRHSKSSFLEDIIRIRAFFSGYMAESELLKKALNNNSIYTGRGGQNAQLLLPLAWYYGEPGYVEDSVYIYHLHNDSHSHKNVTSREKIKQLENYEKIVTETLKRIDDDGVQGHINAARQIYARMKFGNAVDTKDPVLIKTYYQQLKKLKQLTLHDICVYYKYKLLHLI